MSLKNVALMGGSTGVRLVFGLLTFSCVARFLGPEEFGTVMLWLSVATLVFLPANFGFTAYVLREIGIGRASGLEAVKAFFEQVIAAKLILATSTLAVCLVACVWIPRNALIVFALLLAMQFADSFTDLLNVGYRATDRFGAETRVTLMVTILQFFMVYGIVGFWPTSIGAAAALAITRLVLLFYTWFDQAQYFGRLRIAETRLALIHIKAGRTYAIDFGLQNLFGHVDNLVLNHFLSPIAVGLHQAGLKVFQGGGQVANILANVFIPKVAAVHRDVHKLREVVANLHSTFIASGLLFGAALYGGAAPLTEILYGNQFASLESILPWFGLLFYVRFIASAFGIVLTSLGKQGLRAKANLVHWAVILGASYFLVPGFGNIGWLMAACLGNLFLAIIYFLGSKREGGFAVRNFALIAIGAGVFSPLLLQVFGSKG